MRSPPLLSDVLFQAGSRYAAVALQVVRGLVLAALLGPLGMGTVAAVLLILAWAVYSDLGVGEAAMRELPLAVGRAISSVRRPGNGTRSPPKSREPRRRARYPRVAIVAGDQLPADLRFGMITASS